MILIELFFGMVIAAFVLLFLPLVLLMAGVGVALLLWILAPFAMLGGLILWLIFPGSYGLAVLVIALIVGLLLVDRRSKMMEPWGEDRPRYGGRPRY